MDAIQLKVLEYISQDDNKDHLQELLANDPEYFTIFINMEIIGNYLGMDFDAALLNNLTTFIKGIL
jgi:hypothetical protein